MIKICLSLLKINSISGLEFFSCIPGTIGGAIRMNSGCYSSDVSNSLISIQAIEIKVE